MGDNVQPMVEVQPCWLCPACSLHTILYLGSSNCLSHTSHTPTLCRAAPTANDTFHPQVGAASFTNFGFHPSEAVPASF